MGEAEEGGQQSSLPRVVLALDQAKATPRPRRFVWFVGVVGARGLSSGEHVCQLCCVFVGGMWVGVGREGKANTSCGRRM